MSIADGRGISKTRSRTPRLNIPQPIILIMASLGIGVAYGVNSAEMIDVFNDGFGRSLGDFALILIPSFILAACVARHRPGGAGLLMTAAAPVTAAGMVCPDTSYAALSSAAGRYKLSVAFGSFAGYRLLFPAGPLIVATGLGIDEPGLFVVGLLLLIPVWLAGELWVRYRMAGTAGDAAVTAASADGPRQDLARALLPLFLLAGLLVSGGLADLSAIPPLDFITHPKGALLASATFALLRLAPEHRRDCLDTALRRSGWLLLVIGAASALGGMLMHVIPIGDLLPAQLPGGAVVLFLFTATMALKVIHGSSMATLATAAPILAPVASAASISPSAAVFAICLGSIAIMPTDSFYWLVRSDALTGHGEASAVATLAGGALVQALIGLCVLYALNAGGIV